MTEFSALVGRTLKRVERASDDKSMTFVCFDGDVFRLWHMQDCCESVSITDVIGDLDDLIGTPILVAEERSHSTREGRSSERPEWLPAEMFNAQDESDTWTFYTLRTVKGTVDVRWWGSSNGYYSESVDFDQVRS